MATNVLASCPTGYNWLKDCCYSWNDARQRSHHKSSAVFLGAVIDFFIDRIANFTWKVWVNLLVIKRGLCLGKSRNIIDMLENNIWHFFQIIINVLYHDSIGNILNKIQYFFSFNTHYSYGNVYRECKLVFTADCDRYHRNSAHTRTVIIIFEVYQKHRLQPMVWWDLRL